MSTRDTKNKHSRNAPIDRDVRAWGPLFGRLTEVIDWALDIAARLSLDYEEDLTAIENVRAFAHAWLSGQPAELPMSDLLTVIAILFSAIEIDLGIDSASVFAPFVGALDTRSKLLAFLRLPAARDDYPTIVRRFPGRRNARAAFTTQLAS